MSGLYDVIVVGGGGSGLAAAVSAAERGLAVFVLEKNPQPGGTTGIAIGSFTSNRTSLQMAAGIGDSADDHEADAGQFAPPDIEARNCETLRAWFLSQSAETFEWLRTLGVSFHGPNPEPPNRVPRMHNVVPNAKAYIHALSARLKKLGGTLQCDARVQKLLVEDDRIQGVSVRIGAASLACKARLGVILATGDYANSPEILARWKGEKFAEIEGINRTATGEGHVLAEDAGAEMVNMDITYGPELRFVPPPANSLFSRLPAKGIWPQLAGKLSPLVPKFLQTAIAKRLLVTWQHPENSLFDDGAILVNNRGERFCNEKQSPEREIALARQPDKLGYILLDERLIERYSRWPNFVSTAPEIAYAYVKDYLKLRPDVACRGKTLAEVADKRGVPRFNLERTVDAFNRRVQGSHHADPWDREGDDFPLEGNRWVLFGPAKAYFTTTEGGARVNFDLEVLDAGGNPIPGLYAVGQVGLGGQILWGHGLHIAWALTSGRLAGQAIGREAPDAARQKDAKAELPLT